MSSSLHLVLIVRQNIFWQTMIQQTFPGCRWRKRCKTSILLASPRAHTAVCTTHSGSSQTYRSINDLIFSGNYLWQYMATFCQGCWFCAGWSAWECNLQELFCQLTLWFVWALWNISRRRWQCFGRGRLCPEQQSPNTEWSWNLERALTTLTVSFSHRFWKNSFFRVEASLSLRAQFQRLWHHAYLFPLDKS